MDEELKIVILLKGTKALLGVSKKDCDPVMETIVDTTLDDALAAVPNLVTLARARWATNPRNPKYEGPPVEKPPAPVPQRQPVAATAKPKDPQVAAGQKTMF